MVRVKPNPKYVDLAKLRDKKKRGPKVLVQATLKIYFKVDHRYSRPDPKVNMPKTAAKPAKPEIKMAHCSPQPEPAPAPAPSPARAPPAPAPPAAPAKPKSAPSLPLAYDDETEEEGYDLPEDLYEALLGERR